MQCKVNQITLQVKGGSDMFDDLQLNVPLLRRRVPNLTVAAKSVGLRPATVSNLCTGQIPVGRAEVRTLAALAHLAGCTLDDLLLKGAGAGMIETGIKAIDLFAPLVRGGTVGLVARAGLGKLVIVQELMYRLRQRGFMVLLWMPEQVHPDALDLIQFADHRFTEMAPVEEMARERRTSQDVLIVADRSYVTTGELYSLRERLTEPGARPITFTLLDLTGETPDEDDPFGPLETLWRFDAEMAARRLFPAVDPVHSTSTLLEGAHVEASHLTLQQRARRLLRRYRELNALVRAYGAERLPAGEEATFRRGERLEAFMTQPLYVAEPYTKQAGESIPLSDSLDGIRRILDGQVDETPVQSLLYVGALPR